MHPIFRAAIALTAASIVIAPVAASAAPAVDGMRAVSATSGTNQLEGNSSWLIGLIGLLAGVAAIIIVASNDDDAPVSP
ncbi:hypothetical protein [Sphingopyxis sp. DBS4]|uniref:hypothetical protein n=1 Tax=Sphingopyxis sp. DBS4 TaxID=2968500 RepID=UPI00214ABDF6|nr:hypothetical protein [Sphingopyxis sp. DBS4]